MYGRENREQGKRKQCGWVITGVKLQEDGRNPSSYTPVLQKTGGLKHTNRSIIDTENRATGKNGIVLQPA